jgi:YhcH/YjgK/YiaL family protein
MIFDNISNARLYTGVSPKIQRALEYLQQTDLAALAVGRYELDGKNLFVLIQEYSSKLPEQGKWEAHRRYIDLQYIVQGSEKMGYAPISRLQQGTYDPVKDFLPLSGDGVYVTMQGGDFMLLWPDDGHKPGMAIEAPAAVKKAVVKISIDE